MPQINRTIFDSTDLGQLIDDFIEQTIEEQKEANIELQHELDELQHELDELNEKYGFLLEDYTALKDDYDALQQEMDELRAMMDAA